MRNIGKEGAYFLSCDWSLDSISPLNPRIAWPSPLPRPASRLVPNSSRMIAKDQNQLGNA